MYHNVSFKIKPHDVFVGLNESPKTESNLFKKYFSLNSSSLSLVICLNPCSFLFYYCLWLVMFFWTFLPVNGKSKEYISVNYTKSQKVYLVHSGIVSLKTSCSGLVIDSIYFQIYPKRKWKGRTWTRYRWIMFGVWSQTTSPSTLCKTHHLPHRNTFLLIRSRVLNRTDRVFVSREKEKGMTLREPIKERVFKEKEYEIIRMKYYFGVTQMNPQIGFIEVHWGCQTTC